MTTNQPTQDQYAQTASELITALGGRDNIHSLTCCITRLRVRVARPAAVEHLALRTHPAILGRLHHTDGELHLIVGPAAVGALTAACQSVLSPELT